MELKETTTIAYISNCRYTIFRFDTKSIYPELFAPLESYAQNIRCATKFGCAAATEDVSDYGGIENFFFLILDRLYCFTFFRVK